MAQVESFVEKRNATQLILKLRFVNNNEKQHIYILPKNLAGIVN
jgi:hypothetical protein